MQDLEKNNVHEIIYNIITERADEFTWACPTPDSYDDEDDYEEEVDETPQSPTVITLTNIRNMCDTIQNSLVNSGTLDESFVAMELLEIENKLRDINDTLNTMQNISNNQPQILTGDIVLA